MYVFSWCRRCWRSRTRSVCFQLEIFKKKHQDWSDDIIVIIISRAAAFCTDCRRLINGPAGRLAERYSSRACWEQVLWRVTETPTVALKIWCHAADGELWSNAIQYVVYVWVHIVSSASINTPRSLTHGDGTMSDEPIVGPLVGRRWRRRAVVHHRNCWVVDDWHASTPQLLWQKRWFSVEISRWQTVDRHRIFGCHPHRDGVTKQDSHLLWKFFICV